MPASTELIPFYRDWTFWSFIVALLAFAFSQLPPIHRLFKRGYLKVEVGNRIRVTHQIGNPIIGLYMNVSNSGGWEIQIRAVSLDISRDGNHLVTLPAPDYFEKATDSNPVLFIPFSLHVSGQWAHGVNFYNYLNRNTEKLFRQSKTALVEHINARRRELGDENSSAVQADENLVLPFMDIFKSNFIWVPGEYNMVLKVDSTPKSASLNKAYRFTLYESDSEELESYTNDYAFGAGVYFPTDTHRSLYTHKRIQINRKCSSSKSVYRTILA